MYPEKGTNYFGYEDARDWKWADEGEPPCSGIFGSTRSMNTRPRSQARLGKMPSVRYHPSTSARQRQPAHACGLPDVQVIVSLRNPAERAYSGY